MIKRRLLNYLLYRIIIVMGILFISGDVLAGTATNGRFTLTFQNLQSGDKSERSFLQSYQMTTRDKFFRTNDVAISLYFNSSKNFTHNRTNLRYRGQVEIKNPYYSLNSLFTPKQRVTPLEQEMSQERMQNQHTLAIHIPKLPHVRLSYERDQRYTNGEVIVNTRSIRGDLDYRYKILHFNLNRWNERIENKSTSSTTVTGGSARILKTFGATTVSSGYEYQATESTQENAFIRRVVNQIFSGLLSSRYKKYITGSLSLTSKRLSLNNDETLEGRNDTYAFHASILPAYPLHFDISRDYRLSKQDGTKRISDYMSTQVVLTGKITKRASGRIHVNRRFNMNGTNAIIPANLYIASVSSQAYRGIDLRAEINVSERQDLSSQGASSELKRFQTTSIFDMFLRPRKNFTINPQFQVLKYSDRLAFLKNDRLSYGFSGNYHNTDCYNLNMGFSLRRELVTNGKRYESTSMRVNFGLSTRKRTSFNVSYGTNATDYLASNMFDTTALDTESNNLILQTQYWLFQRGSISLNYTDSKRGNGSHARYVNVHYVQHF